MEEEYEDYQPTADTSKKLKLNEATEQLLKGNVLNKYTHQGQGPHARLCRYDANTCTFFWRKVPGESHLRDTEKGGKLIDVMTRTQLAAIQADPFEVRLSVEGYSSEWMRLRAQSKEVADLWSNQLHRIAIGGL